jgi:ligand-binding sensor domain-containing protein/two-component sensor histidine kinase
MFVGNKLSCLYSSLPTMQIKQISSLLLLCVCIATNAQYTNNYNYSVKEGLPQSQVFALAQDSFGYIWVGTQGGGIARFDGSKFQTYSTQQGLESSYVNTLYVSSDNTLWVGTTSGLNYLKGKEVFKLVSTDDNQPKITTIAEYKNKIYVGTTKGLKIYDTINKKLQHVKINQPLDDVAINEIKIIDSKLWLATEKGLWKERSNGNNFVKIGGIPTPNVHRIYDDSYGNIWVGVFDYGLIQLDKKSEIVLNTSRSEFLKKIKSILSITKNELWLGTENEGISILQIPSMKMTQKNIGLNTNKIQALIKDKWGNMWIGTSGEGLEKITEQVFRHYNMYNYGFSGNSVYGISTLKNGKIYLALNQNNIGYYNGSTFKSLTINTTDVASKNKTIAIDNSNKIWLGTEDKGVICIDGKKETRYNVANKSLLDDRIIQILVDNKDRVWVSTLSTGLQCFTKYNHGYRYTRINKFHGLTDQYINVIAEDKKNNRLFFGTRSGIVGYIDAQFKITEFGKQNGLPSQAIKTMTIDENGNCYVAITGIGIYVSDVSSPNPVFKKMELKDKYYSTNIYSMTFSNNELWLGTEDGVYQLIINPDERSVKNIFWYSIEDGFLGIENCHNSIAKDTEGNIWFGTMNGVVKYMANAKTYQQQPPSTFIDDITLMNKDVSGIDMTKYFSLQSSKHFTPLAYDKNYLSFSFQGVHLNFNEKIKYRYVLDGGDGVWSDWTDEKRVHFSNLNPGKYCFKVQSTFDKIRLGNIAQVWFEIASPFWKKLWFKLLSIIAIATSIFYTSKVREENIRKKNEVKNKELTLKNELLTLEQKALQLQMNPHFIFNALNSIQSLVVNKEPEAAREQIQNFAQLMRSILNNSRRKTINLKEEIESLEQYLSMEQFCQKNKFEFNIDISENINVEETQLPSMLIQPYVENAIIHGISHLKSSGIISIEFKLDDRTLKCTIKDNGVGREKSKEYMLNQTEGHTSIGMNVTRQRLIALNQGDENAETIIDLFDVKGNPSGTEVVLKIPIDLNY